MPRVQETPTVLTLHTTSAWSDMFLGVVLVVFGILSLASISYLFQYTTLTCQSDEAARVHCTIQQYLLSGTDIREVQDVQAVYIAELETAGAGDFQVIRDQIVLIATEEDVAVPYFYSADFGRVQAFEARIRNFLENPSGELLLRANHQVETEFLHGIAGVVLIAIGAAQMGLHITRWTFDKSNGDLVITRHRLLSHEVIDARPTAVHVECSTDYQPGLQPGQKQRSWIALWVASGQHIRLTHKYAENEKEAATLNDTALRLRKFLHV